MKELLLFLALCVITSVPLRAADIIVPTESDPVINGASLQSALDGAQCGDTVVLQAGATYDGTFYLANKGCDSTTPITITSSAVSALPARVSPADVANMARVRTLGGGSYGAAFQAQQGAGWWVLDGVEITDNGPNTTIIHMLVDLSDPSVHDMVVRRSYLHNKEVGTTNYFRSIRFGVQFEGSRLTLQGNHIDIIGYYQPEIIPGYYPLDTMALVAVGGNTITMVNNFLSVWHSGIFTGGGDTAPQNSAVLSDSSLTSAAFSNTTGLEPGLVLRLDLEGTAISAVTASGVTLRRTSGVVLTSADIGRPTRITASNGQTGAVKIAAVDGDTITATPLAWQWMIDGPVDFAVYETAAITSVDGNVVGFSPVGVNALTQAPLKASWNYGDQGLVHDVTLQANTFYIDPAFALDVIAKNGNGPKGYFEIKNAKRMLVEGNRFIGFPSLLAWTASNQNGTAPWITTSDLIVRNNLIAPDAYPQGVRQAIIISNNGYIHTDTPSKNVQIYNNLIIGVQGLLQLKGIDDVSIRHNTILNDGVGTGGYNNIIAAAESSNGFSFVDNIVSHRFYGMSCFEEPFTLNTCFPSGVFANNAVVDPFGVGVSLGAWGPGGILNPEIADFAAVGFTDAANSDYRLLSSSLFKGLASDGSDPGVDMDALLAALSGTADPPPPPPPPPAETKWLEFK